MTESWSLQQFYSKTNHCSNKIIKKNFLSLMYKKLISFWPDLRFSVKQYSLVDNERYKTAG